MSHPTLSNVSRLACLALIALAAISPAFSQSRMRKKGTPGRAATHPAVISRYIEALKARDLKTVVDLTLDYQQAVVRIKSSNPRALWPRRIDEYYEKKMSNLTESSRQWGDLARSTMAMEGDPAENLRAALPLLPQSCKWKVSEVRNETNLSPIYGQYGRTSVYITVDYPLDESTPIINKAFLKQTILNVPIYAGTQLVMNVFKVDGADVFWTKPYPQSAIAFLIDKYKTDVLRGDRHAINELTDVVGWEGVEPYLLTVLEQGPPRTPSFNVALEFLADKHVQKAVPTILRALKGRNPLLEGNWSHPDQNLVSALEKIGASDSKASALLLKERLSFLISRMNRDYYKDVRAHLWALASVDNNQDWLSFPFLPKGREGRLKGQYIEGNVFESIPGEVLRDPSSIDPNSNSSDETHALVRELKPCKGSGCPSRRLAFEQIRISDAMNVEIYGRIDEGLYGRTTKAGRFTMFLNRRAEQPDNWFIQKLVRH